MCCNKNYSHKFDEKLKEQFFNTYKFSNHNNNKFTLLLRESVYSHEYRDDWKKLDETSLPEKEDFYSHLSMEDITAANWAHAKITCKDFEIKNSGDYHDLYVQSDTFMLANVFENFVCVLKYTNLILQNFFRLQD